MFTLIDCNNFWSPSGGGVRRYHLEKLASLSEREGWAYVFVMQGDRAETERIGTRAFVEHVRAPRVPGARGYRFLWRASVLEEIFARHRPDVVEVGCPYLMPGLVRRAKACLPQAPVVAGFWHADFPVTYARRLAAGRLGAPAGRVAERLAWTLARRAYGYMDVILVSSAEARARIAAERLPPARLVPLGVNTRSFHPGRRDPAKVEQIKAGRPDRLTLFFPHRFCAEKGVHRLLDAYPELCRKLDCEPALVFAGTGPDLRRVEAAARRFAHVHYLGFVAEREEMASWFASCEAGVALSDWETFGLSILEAMASGEALVVAGQGAAREHANGAGLPFVLRETTTAALVDALVALAGSDIQAMGRRSRAYAERFTWEACFNRELDIYRELLDARRPAGEADPGR